MPICQRSTWEYCDDRFDPHLLPWRASLFTIGNGHLGTRGTFEEGFAGQESATFINGLYVTPPGDLPVLGAVPEWTQFAISIDGEPFRLDHHPPAGFERTLDMRTGVLTRNLVWGGVNTGVVRVTSRRIASMAEPGLAAIELTFVALSETVTISVATGLDASIAGPYGALWRIEDWNRSDRDALTVRAASVDDAHTLSVSCRVLGLDDVDVLRDPQHPQFRGDFTIEPGRSHTVAKYVTYEIPGAPAAQLPPARVPFDVLAANSAAAWRERWATSSIEVDGDSDAERALRFAAYHLISGSPAVDTRGSIGARLLTGYGYRHHVFWDTDIYVIPYLSVTQPDLALTHLHYRHRGLAGARQKAARYGRTGAFYAWEATDTGEEVSPEWGRMPNGERIRIWTGELEEHISADVAWAANHYWEWTGDDRFMIDHGAEIIFDGAKYWANRLEREADGAHLRNVMGPNEYHVPVDDSFFTNAMAAWQLRTAAGIAAWLDQAEPRALNRLEAALDLSLSDWADFAEVADRVVLMRQDDGVYEERAGFFDLEHVDISEFSPNRMSLHGLLGDKRTQEIRLVKQADVIMGLVLLEGLRTPEALARNFDYYEPITDHGSSLSPAMHALAASMIGRSGVAYDFFRKAIAIDHEDAMVRGGLGIHAATQGGILQAALFGFGGLHLANGEPQVRPALPEHWNSLGFSFVHQGKPYEREVTSKQQDGSASTATHRI